MPSGMDAVNFAGLYSEEHNFAEDQTSQLEEDRRKAAVDELLALRGANKQEAEAWIEQYSDLAVELYTRALSSLDVVVRVVTSLEFDHLIKDHLIKDQLIEDQLIEDQLIEDQLINDQSLPVPATTASSAPLDPTGASLSVQTAQDVNDIVSHLELGVGARRGEWRRLDGEGLSGVASGVQV